MSKLKVINLIVQFHFIFLLNTNSVRALIVVDCQKNIGSIPNVYFELLFFCEKLDIMK